MFDFHYFVTGYVPVVLALVLVLAYFVLAALLLRVSGPAGILVSRYEPPPGASPAVAAWLFEPGELPRAMAAAVVNMAAKRFLKIEQSGELYSLTKLETEPSAPLEPEEDALARTLFDGYDCFDFDEETPQLRDAIRALRWALQDTRYFSEHIALSVPAWIVSGLGGLFALAQGDPSTLFNPYLGIDILVTLGCFIVAVRSLPGPLEKIASRFPGSTAPRRPWTGADSRPFTFLQVALGGVAILALLSSNAAALFTAAFLLINAVFFHALQGPTSAGRKIAEQLAEYRNFLSEVDADAISRVRASDRAPRELSQKDAYALAFHLDLGWGEQFVTSIADLIEFAEVREVVTREDDPAG